MVSNEDKAAAAVTSKNATDTGQTMGGGATAAAAAATIAGAFAAAAQQSQSQVSSSSNSNASPNTTNTSASGGHHQQQQQHNPSPRPSPRVSPRVSPGAPGVPLSPAAAAAAAAAALAAKAAHSSFSIDKTEEFVFTVPEEAPVFVPTVEEFKNPLTYINKIRPQAEKYGICKIRPPSTWQPPFTVNVDKLRFTPRVQRLNELEAKTRVKLNFLDQIAKFWELQGSSLKIPMVERKALDLYSLHRLVQEEGGLDQATRERKWSNIAARMGYPSGKSVGTILKGHYERILYPFDLFTHGGDSDDKVKSQQKLEPEGGDHDYKPHGIVSRQKVVPPREPTARRSQRIDAAATEAACAAEDRKIKEEQEASGSAADMRRMKFFARGGTKHGGENGGGGGGGGGGAAVGPKSRMNGGGGANNSSNAGGKRGTAAAAAARRNHLDPLAKYICHVCDRGDSEEAMLLCDGCDDSYHTFCLMPPLQDVPKGEWRCPKCVVEEVSKPTEAFGFEQAQREYTLQQFGEMADQFKSEYFNIPVHLVPTQMVEREFWRIVSSIDEDVVVEYGADLHTMDHGSGFPTKSSLYLLPGDQEYAESSWNLNNLPLLEESILGHINADISGMKVPWMYVGMCFATFCWHNEDHWSYSINYLHWGEPKTWYGVPGSKAEAFEKTMKRAAPELFQSQPDLLHQLVTIMNPNILMTDGVPVYRTDQHAGEFIITFPRAYHAGFNQGYNFAEAVNFAPADWMKIGRECINHYSTLRRFCVFSHDELVCKMALDPDKLKLGIATACYLDMAEMVDCEKKLRKSLLEWGVTRAEREAFELIPDDERQCEVCKTTCFLSAVTCTCCKTLVCLRHYSELCKCAPDKHTLKYRYTLDELPLMLRKLKVKAESFEFWLGRVSQVIDPNSETVITLDELQELAQEAEDKRFPGSVLLERLNSAVLEAEKCVTVIQQLDINKMRTRTRNSSEFAKYKLTLEELELFVQEIDNLCCIIPEGASVRELQQMGSDFVEQAQALLKHDDLIDLDETEVKRLLDEGSSLCIELPQLKQLRVLYDQLHWYADVRDLRETGDKLPQATVKRLLEQGMRIVPHPTLERELSELQAIMMAVEMWETSAQLCFQNDTQHELHDVEQLLAQAEHIEGNLPSQPALRDALRKAKEWLAAVDQLQNNENYPYLHTIEAVIQRGRQIPFQLAEMRRMEDHVVTAIEWKERVGKTFLRKGAPFSLLDALTPRPQAVMLADAYPRRLTEAQYVAQFSEETGPVQVVMAFKEGEAREVSEMRELRDANATKSPEDDRYCVCRRGFFGQMYNCQLCLDWFHEGCVPAPKRRQQRARLAAAAAQAVAVADLAGGGRERGATVVPQLTERERDRELRFLCPSCMRSRRPRLETILLLLMSLQRLPIRLPEGEALQCLTERAMNWQDRARQALANAEVVTKLATLAEIAAKQQQQKARASGGGGGGEAAAGVGATKKTIGRAAAAAARRASESSESSQDLDESGASSIAAVDAADKSIEHAYSSTTNDQTAGIITLSDGTRTQLLELMMEGDLLEVCLDEAHHLWRILNAAKPGQSDLTLINLRYTIMPNPEELVIANRKHNDTDEDDGTPNTSLAPANSSATSSAAVTPASAPASRKSGGGKRSAAAAAAAAATADHSAAAQSPLTPHNNSGAASAPNSANSAAASAASSKLKRGRKLKMTPAEKSAAGGPGATGGTATAAAAAAASIAQSAQSAAAAAAAAKKKRGRKTVPDSQSQSQTPTTAPSTSDEEEECSATNCVRPAGREVDWVQCDGGCNKWYHMYCVGLVKNQIKPDDDYVCRKCKKQSNSADPTAPSSTATTTTATATTTTSASAKSKQRVRPQNDDDDDEDEDDEDDDDDEDAMEIDEDGAEDDDDDDGDDDDDDNTVVAAVAATGSARKSTLGSTSATAAQSGSPAVPASSSTPASSSSSSSSTAASPFAAPAAPSSAAASPTVSLKSKASSEATGGSSSKKPKL